MRYLGIAVALLLAGWGWTDTETVQLTQPTDEFAQANELYLAGDYQAAAQIYETMLAGGAHSAVVYYNLGNAYAQNGDLGAGVLNYRRALLLAPRDRDIIHNLANLESQVAHQPSSWEAESWVRMVLVWLLSRLTINELAVITMSFYWLAVAMAIWRIRSRRRLVSVLLIASLLVFCISAGLSYAKWQRDYAGGQAIVLSDAEMYSGPGQHFEPLARLGAGTEVKLVQTQGRYIEIQTGAGGHGWVSGEQARPIFPFAQD